MANTTRLKQNWRKYGFCAWPPYLGDHKGPCIKFAPGGNGHMLLLSTFSFSSTDLASLIFESALEEYFSLNSYFFSSEKLFPGLKVFTKKRPIDTERTVENKYNNTVLDPILDNRVISDNDATPLINDAKTSGTAISFNRLTKITPHGLIQSVVKSLNPKE